MNKDQIIFRLRKLEHEVQDLIKKIKNPDPKPTPKLPDPDLIKILTRIIEPGPEPKTSHEILKLAPSYSLSEINRAMKALGYVQGVETWNGTNFRVYYIKIKP